MIRVLLVDDHATLRQSFAFLVEQEEDMSVVGQAGTMREARELLEDVDVAVVDLSLPDGDGVQLIREYVCANPDGAALVLTASELKLQHARAVEAGAAGVIHKFVEPEEVIRAIRRLAAGEHLMSRREVVAMNRLTDDRRKADQSATLPFEQLTAREREVLQAMADGLSDQEIADRMFVSLATVRTHVRSIRGKLEVKSRWKAVLLAARHGVVEVR